MTMYLTKFSLTPQTWARLQANPEDRRKTLAPVIETAGGKLHGYWYAFGEADGFFLLELPDDVAAATIMTMMRVSGAFTTLSTTKLITVDEMLDALSRGGRIEYRAPGAASS